MEKEIRKTLCEKCLDAVRNIEASLMKKRRKLKVKLKVEEKGKVKINKK